MLILKHHRQTLEGSCIAWCAVVEYLDYELTPLKANAARSYHFCRQDNIALVHRLG